MKKGLLRICAALLLFSGCALFPRKAQEINWPERVDHLEAMCELDMAWKDMNYSGSMSLMVDYPTGMRMEVYGPFGDTAVFMKKEKDNFLLMAGDEKFTDEKAFEEKFDIALKDFMDDVTLRSLRSNGDAGPVVKGSYRVVYDLGGRSNRICWEGRDGRICVKFLEARFGE